MTDTANRVLTLAEVLALPEGARVWVDDREWKTLCGAHHVEHKHCDEEAGKYIGFCLIHGDKYWPVDDDFEGIVRDGDVRVWSLPQPPTPQELEKNPWEVQDGKRKEATDGRSD